MIMKRLTLKLKNIFFVSARFLNFVGVLCVWLKIEWHLHDYLRILLRFFCLLDTEASNWEQSVHFRSNYCSVCHTFYVKRTSKSHNKTLENISLMPVGDLCTNKLCNRLFVKPTKTTKNSHIIITFLCSVKYH